MTENKSMEIDFEEKYDGDILDEKNHVIHVTNVAFNDCEVTIGEINNHLPARKEKRKIKSTKRFQYNDRQNIMKRVKMGEKQADLAREYNVSKAAISHMIKNNKSNNNKNNNNNRSAYERRSASGYHIAQYKDSISPPEFDFRHSAVRSGDYSLF
jgi:hypothetical protein